MTAHLRDADAPAAASRCTTHFDFAEGGMHAAADRCQRIGACRKTGAGVMCPSYMATREEEHATRGRANALVKALSEPDPAAALGDERLHEILDLCLECKACKSECPLSVDMASLKSEFLSHYNAIHGTPLRSRLFGVDPDAEPARRARPRRCRTCRAPARRCSGIDRRAPAAAVRARDADPLGPQPARRAPGTRAVVFLADSFTTFTEPGVGRAAIELLDGGGLRRAARARRAAAGARASPRGCSTMPARRPRR